MTDWEALRAQIRIDRGNFCEVCDIAPWEQLHHCLIHRQKGRYELDVSLNLMCVCQSCHEHANGYRTRCKFWRTQCKRYGHDRMVEWLEGLGLKVPPKFE